MIKTLNAETIHLEILSQIKNGSPILDALVLFAEENGLEIETLAEVVKKSPVLVNQLEDEAVNLKLVHREERAELKFI